MQRDQAAAMPPADELPTVGEILLDQSRQDQGERRNVTPQTVDPDRRHGHW
jgi:hypothetical protein